MVPSKNLYSLVNGVARNKSHPETFTIPSEVERNNVLEGSFVKLIFLDNKTNAVERMWVQVTDISMGDQFFGKLDNTPVLLTFLEIGETITFGPEHIIDIMG